LGNDKLWPQKENKSIISFSCISHQRSQRPQNQDFYGKFRPENLSPKGQLFVVTHGIDSHTETRKASELAVNTIQQVYYSHPSEDVARSLKQAFLDANTLIHELFNDKAREPLFGISCTALVLTKDRIYIAHVGDNRAYRISHHKIERLTNGHTQPGENYHQGTLTKKESELHFKPGCALGGESPVNISIKMDIPLREGDCFFLCNNGLANVDDNLIKYVVLSNSPHQACKKLVSLANELGSKDDIDVQVIRINPVPVPPLWARLISVKTTSKSKLLWLSSVLFILLVITATYIFVGKPGNQTVELAKQDRFQKKSLSINQKSPLRPEGTNSEPAQRMAGTVFSITELRESFKEGRDSIPQNGYSQEALTANSAVGQLQANTDELKFPKAENKVLKNRNAIFDKIELIKGVDPDAWDFQRLTNDDLELKKNKIIFLNSPRKKIALYQGELANFSFRVQAQVFSRNVTRRFGIIVGHTVTEESPFETFYLFSVFGNKQFLFQRITNLKKELIASFPAKLESMDGLNTIQLKVIGHGRNIIVYANQRRLYAWTADERIKGQVGLYSDANLRVEFSNIRILKAGM
jgi:protein phosphatase